MKRRDHQGKTAEPRREEQKTPERKVAPPIEREHETYEGVMEEEERERRDEPKP